jgi:hypothetical protein
VAARRPCDLVPGQRCFPHAVVAGRGQLMHRSCKGQRGTGRQRDMAIVRHMPSINPGRNTTTYAGRVVRGRAPASQAPPPRGRSQGRTRCRSVCCSLALAVRVVFLVACARAGTRTTPKQTQTQTHRHYMPPCFTALVQHWPNTDKNTVTPLPLPHTPAHHPERPDAPSASSCSPPSCATAPLLRPLFPGRRDADLLPQQQHHNITSRHTTTHTTTHHSTQGDTPQCSGAPQRRGDERRHPHFSH